MSIDAQSGEPLGGAAVASTPPPPPEAEPTGGTRSPLRTWAYVAGGVGAAGLVTFAVAGLMAHSTYDDLNRACNGGPCPADKSGEISSGKTQQTVANVGLAVGIVGLATGATLFVLSLPKGAPASNAALVVSPSWAGVQGRF